MTEHLTAEAKGGFDLRRLMLSVLFFYMVTPFDFYGASLGGGGSLFLKVILTVGFLLILLAARPYIANRNIMFFAIAASGIFILINLPALGNLVVIEAAIIFLCVVVSDFAVEDFRKDFIFILGAYLAINLVGLTLSVAWVWQRGTIYDFHHLLFPMSAARQGLQYGIPRPSGFQLEPGDYAAWIPLAVFFRGLLLRKVHTPLHLVCVASTLLTFSAWAVVGFALYLAAAGSTLSHSIIVNRKVRKGILLAILIAVPVSIVLVATVPAVSRLVTDITSQYFLFLKLRYASGATGGSSFDVTMVGLESFKESWTNSLLIGQPLEYIYCPKCLLMGAMPGQLGVWSMFAYHVGVIPSVLFFIVLLYRLRHTFGMPFVFLMASALISRIYLFDFMLWMILTTILFSTKVGIQTSPPGVCLVAQSSA